MPTTPAALEPWDRRAGETPVAFRAFTLYRDMGATRSLRKLVAQCRDSGIRATLSLVCQWSKTADWVDRADMWDQFLDREGRLEQVEQVREMRRRHAAVANVMVAKAAERLRTIEGAKLSVRDALLLFEAGTKIERVARGEPDLVIDHKGETVSTRPEPTGTEILALLAENPDLADFAQQLSGVISLTEG